MRVRIGFALLVIGTIAVAMSERAFGEDRPPVIVPVAEAPAVPAPPPVLKPIDDPVPPAPAPAVGKKPAAKEKKKSSDAPTVRAPADGKPRAANKKDDEDTLLVDDQLNNHTEQAVTLEWVGPAMIKIGQTFTYELVIRNNGAAKVTDVLVRDKFPEGMKVTAIEPKGTPDGDGVVWNLGGLDPRQESRIRIEMLAAKKGEVVCHATVSATSPAMAKFRVTEPQLAIKQSSPDKVQIGDPATFSIAIANPGDGPADGVVIRAALTPGLKHEKGSEFSYELGTLAAGETRTVQIVCDTIKGGNQMVKTQAVGEGGLEAQAESAVAVTEAKLDLAMTGPKLRYLDRSAVYTVAIANPGDSPANNIRLNVQMPAGFKYTTSTQGGRHDAQTRTISWFLGSLNAGEKREVQYSCVAAQTGQHKHVAAAVGQRGIKAESEVMTNVEGISALLLEVVDVDDPVEVGTDTAYEIRVTNQGSREATNVEIHALVPKEMIVRGGQGPTNYRIEGQEIIFAPLAKLAPRADAIYRVFVRGTGVGDVRFRARLVSDSLAEPVIEEESTKVYED